MSSPSITDPLEVPAELSDRSLSALVTRPLKRVAFWAAIVLPFLHVPLLASGLQSQDATVAFVTLLALNVTALAVGYYFDD
ncbi:MULTISPECIES: hypothetical protein [Salinibaculum]|uniref:hypothetical protein n=1 Tax=Salinibaculum TaxID=2732368 RepID=UPI0030D48799